MKYVASIDAKPEGKVRNLLYRAWRPIEALAVTVHDTCTGEDEVLDCMSVLKLGPVGFGENVTYDGCAGVCHDIKTINLFRHVTKVESKPGVVGVDFDSSDLIEVGENGEFDFIWAKNKRNIVIDTGHDIYNIRGKFGSVVTKFWADEYRIECYSLYDFLVLLCRRFNKNLLKYETIQLYSKNGNYTLTVRLKHTAEAERYFTKMWMDVCSE